MTRHDPNWRQAYASMTNPFGAKGSFYDAEGHRGADYRRLAGQTVPSYIYGVVEYVGRSSGLGGIVGIRDNAGGFAGWAHVANPEVAVGDQVEPGTVLGTAASGGVWAGSLWAGAHIHTTRTNSSAAAAATGVRPLLDPVPFISRAIGGSSPAGGGGSPITLKMKDDTMIRIQAPARGIALVGPGYYRQLTSDEEVIQSDPMVDRHYSGNERQFDLWVSMCIGGTSAVTNQVNAAKSAADAAARNAAESKAAADQAKNFAQSALAKLNAGISLDLPPVNVGIDDAAAKRIADAIEFPSYAPIQ